MRAGRRSSKRSSGGIEPFHTLEVSVEDRGGDLLSIKETRFITVRETLVGDLDAMDAGGTALRWARHLLPTRHADPFAWTTLVRFLDALNAPTSASPSHAAPRGLLAMAGFALLSSAGYALELSHCVICGRACPDGAPAYVNAARGGLVCRSCGGGGRLLDGPTRELAARAQHTDPASSSNASSTDALTVPDWLTATQAEDLLSILSVAMAAHTDLDPSK